MIEVLDKGFVELVDKMGDDLTVVNAARVSVGKHSEELNDRDKNLIKYMLENGHTSPFEHVVFTFRVKCPLCIRSQWHRHRTQSYNEISRRYTSEGIEFYTPTEMRKQSTDNRQASTDEVITHINDGWDYESNSEILISVESLLLDVFRHCYDTYERLVDAGACREQARIVLPEAMYTVFYATGNLHNWFHFLELRNSPHAQYEMRLYAQALEDIVKEQVPVSYKLWKELKNVL